MRSPPLDQLSDGTPDERAAAARTVREVADRRPARLQGSLDRLGEAASDGYAPVRRNVMAALAAVADDDPPAVGPVAETLVDAVEDDVETVRRDAARAVAALATARPQRVRFAVAPLVASLTDAEAVRTETARALAALSPRYPEAVHVHLDALVRALLDEHHPVQAAVLRALTPVEQTYPGALDAVGQRLQDLIGADAPAVRQAACRAVAANSPSWAETELRERYREDPHPVVRETAQAALAVTDAADAPPETPGGTAMDVLEAVTLGTWVVVRAPEDGELFVGRVSVIARAESETDVEARRARGLRREDFDSRDAWLAAPRVEPSGERRAVHLHDPFGDRGVNLVPVSRGVDAEFTGPDGAAPSIHRAIDVRTVGDDRARLLAAAPGDELAFELDGTEHAVEVTTAGERDGTYRVVGENRERGYRITFRPLGPNPLMAVFAKGRAFRASNVQLTTGET